MHRSSLLCVTSEFGAKPSFPASLMKFTCPSIRTDVAKSFKLHEIWQHYSGECWLMLGPACQKILSICTKLQSSSPESRERRKISLSQRLTHPFTAERSCQMTKWTGTKNSRPWVIMRSIQTGEKTSTKMYSTLITVNNFWTSWAIFKKSETDFWT